MSNQHGSTRAQKLFLKAFRQNPSGPPPSEWPTPATLQRWLRDEDFKNALNNFRDTMRFQADFHIAAAANAAAKSIHSTVATPTAATPDADTATVPDLTRQFKSLTDLLRLSHIRQRFTAAPSNDNPSKDSSRDDDTSDPLSREIDPRSFPVNPMVVLTHWPPDRLKAYFRLLIMNGKREFEPFLHGFPEEVAKLEEYFEQYPDRRPAPDSQNASNPI
jgi:hypothetical protein